MDKICQDCAVVHKDGEKCEQNDYCDKCGGECDGAHGSSKEQYDSVVTAVLQKFMDRAKFGKNKYGTDLDRKDLKVADWIQHAQEELMDGILYLEKLKQVTK